ncbi:hypothetical protein AAKU55_002410 [Oxalobacteraceae bacterium GrIS 1.11]
MQKNYRMATTALLSLAGLCFSLAAQALPTVAGSALLTASNESQLASWLGEGNVKLTNIYTKAAGDTSLNFHHAADGKGRTFSVMQASNELGQTWLVGGYNPQSWSSDQGYNRTPENAQRTAFIFNLTSDVVHRQTPKTQVLDEVGSYQTYNGAKFGPTFGIGNDLAVPEDLSTGGVSYMYSYVDPVAGHFGTSLLDGSAFHGPNIHFGAIEVFSISAVPEPETYAMMLAGLALLGWRRKAKASSV